MTTAVLVASALVVAGCGSDDEAGQPATTGGTALSVADTAPAGEASAPSQRLWVQAATGGSLTEGADGSFEITLEGVGTTLWFDDRPARRAGSTPTATFVEGFEATFGTDPPNAVLEVVGPDDGDRRLLPVELTAASMDGDAVRYTATPLDGLPPTVDASDDAAAPEPGSFGPATLFIDDASGQLCAVEWAIPDPANASMTGLFIQSGGTVAANTGGWPFNSGDDNVEAGPVSGYNDDTSITFTGNAMLGQELTFTSILQFDDGSDEIVVIVGPNVGDQGPTYGEPGWSCVVTPKGDGQTFTITPRS